MSNNEILEHNHYWDNDDDVISFCADSLLKVFKIKDWNLIVKEILTESDFEEIVEEMRQEAKEKGLTPEILAELLKHE